MLVILLFIQFGFSQNLEKVKDNSDQLRYEMDVSLKKENLNKDFFIEVPPNASLIRYSVNGKISNGNLKVKVKDSNKRSEGSFILTTNKKEGGKGNTTAKGNYENELNHPISGKWIIRIEAEDVEGNFELSIVIDK